MRVSILIFALLGATIAQAFSIDAHSLNAVTALTPSQINAFTPYAYFSKAVFCGPLAILSWSCGVACDANKAFVPVAVGGDGNGIQYWYVGYDPRLDSVIVAHQGTNGSQIWSVLTNMDMRPSYLDPILFPGLPSDIRVHSGFRTAQSKTALVILSSVQTTMSKYGTHSVTMVGHSLGAALSLLDSVYLPLHLPAGTRFQSFLYGLPRVGNQAFADYVDANLHVIHINNRKETVPIMPGKFMGYVHPTGEIHIKDTGEWVACPGQDNPSTGCIVGDVPNIFVGNGTDHKGPYNGVRFPCLA